MWYYVTFIVGMSSDSIPIHTYTSDEEYSPLTPHASPVVAPAHPPTQPELLTVDSESEPEEEYPVLLSPTLPLPPPSSPPEPKRQRLKPTEDSIVYEEIMHIRSSSSSREWELLPNTIRSESLHPSLIIQIQLHLPYHHSGTRWNRFSPLLW